MAESSDPELSMCFERSDSISLESIRDKRTGRISSSRIVDEAFETNEVGDLKEN